MRDPGTGGRIAMLRLALALATGMAGLAFGAIGLTLALAGLGLPYLLAAILAAAAAGLAAYAALLALMVRPLAPLGAGRPARIAAEIEAQRTRLAALEAMTASLRHDLRGMLSPAMLVSDRLLSHADPKVARAGETVVRSIGRATERLAATRAQTQGEAMQPGSLTPAQQDHSVLPKEPA